jgi:PleD family two-component response regulator
LPKVLSPVAEHVTLSLGVATVVSMTRQPVIHLIEQADQFLFAAKRNGRDQVISGLETIR